MYIRKVLLNTFPFKAALVRIFKKTIYLLKGQCSTWLYMVKKLYIPTNWTPSKQGMTTLWNFYIFAKNVCWHTCSLVKTISCHCLLKVIIMKIQIGYEFKLSFVCSNIRGWEFFIAKFFIAKFASFLNKLSRLSEFSPHRNGRNNVNVLKNKK